MSRADRERNGSVFRELVDAELDQDLEPYIYEAAVTVLMRLVFLLSAEERGLFLLGDPVYDGTYAVSTLLAQLDEDANRYGEDVLERRTDAWHRLLATFRMVHAGAAHANLRLPPYGGSLFDPDRFPFLEGRRPDQPTDEQATPLRIDNRTVKHILDALQVLRFRGRGGWQEARRLSFRSLGVEQIGHVYEGLLDHGVVQVTAEAVALTGRNDAEVALELVEAEAANGRIALVSWLAELTGEKPKSVEKALDSVPEPDHLDRLASACDNDSDLAARVAPYLGLIRADLRGLPQVYLPDSYYVTKSSDRRSSGAYYTPRALAEEMVTHTLEPLVYTPGPAQGAEPDQWMLKPSLGLLDLPICDMAMGSGAFLVSACRYLSERLLEAWDAEALVPGDLIPLPGGATTLMPDGEPDREVLARRVVADRCLYGVDRDPMAAEMAKLSLWLITLAKDRPFTFVDHALRCGDSLLGITDLRQLDSFHLDPVRGRHLHGGTLFDPATRIEPLVKAAMEKRRQLESFTVIDIGDAKLKRQLFDESSALLGDLKIVADVVIGAALSTATSSIDAHDGRLVSVATDVAHALDPDRASDDRVARLHDLRLKAAYWLDEGRPPLTPARRCLHWPLEFPEVFLDRQRPGFDAVIGNPPFLGGKRISGAMGLTFREYLVRWVADGVKGNADLVAYFFLRAAQVADRFGLLATNSVSEGDTREVGLDSLIRRDWTITEAVKTAPWPGLAGVEIAKVWMQRTDWKGCTHLGGVVVRAISPLLDPASRTEGPPRRLLRGGKRSFIGSFVNGIGFVLDTSHAETLIASDPRNSDVLRPYLVGEDLNSRPDLSARRWVINFSDWPIDRAERYSECMRIVRERVKPDRDMVNRKAHRDCWWQYGDKRPLLYETIRGMQRVLVITSVSNLAQPAFVPTGQVFSHMLAIFAYDDDEHFGVLSSAFHWWWAATWASKMRNAIRYTPSDCFDTFAQPAYSAAVEEAGRLLDTHRAPLMIDNAEGLTKTYNRMHSSGDDTPGIAELRERHLALDLAVRDAYGWSDLDLDYGFWDTPFGSRFTVGPTARIEVLDRLLELNLERSAEDHAAGLHDKKPAASGRASKSVPAQGSESLF